MYQDFFNKNDDYLDDFRQKVAEQKIATMEERRTELARSRNNFLGTCAGVVLAGIVGWFVLAPQYEQSNKEIPIIKRSATAVKVKPENPGGMEILNQDKEVYNLVEKKDVDNTVVENLLPTPEKPKLPDIAPETSEIDENAESLDAIVEQEVEEKETEIAEAQIPEKPKDLIKEIAEEKGVAEPNKIEPEPNKAGIKEEAQKVIPKAGNWQIQLLASRNKEAVEKSWSTMSAKYAELKKFDHYIKVDNSSPKGTLYKLRAGSFADKAEAKGVCEALKKQGLADCLAMEK